MLLAEASPIPLIPGLPVLLQLRLLQLLAHGQRRWRVCAKFLLVQRHQILQVTHLRQSPRR